MSLLFGNQGLGRAPSQKDHSQYEHFYAFYDLVIVGGGISGLNAALTAAESGLKILIIEQTPEWGGRCLVDFPPLVMKLVLNMCLGLCQN